MLISIRAKPISIFYIFQEGVMSFLVLVRYIYQMICFIPSKFLHPKGSQLSLRETPVVFIILIESNASQRQKLSGNEVRT